MGARLVYAKVVDRNLFYARGGRVEPGLPNDVIVEEEGGEAAAFLVLRAWTDDQGSVTESWRLESPGGQTIYESAPREVHLPTRDHVEKLQDELYNVKIDYTADYTAVFSLDENEVARVDFPVRVDNQPTLET